MSNRNKPDSDEIKEMVVTAPRPRRWPNFFSSLRHSFRQINQLLPSRLELFGSGGRFSTSDERANCSSSANNANNGWVNPTGGQRRGSDPQGSGAYGATRVRSDGTLGSHKGVDYVAEPGQDVVAVRAGRIERIGEVYTDDPSFKLIVINASDGYVVRQLYVSPADGIVPGTGVSAGQVIGTQQSLVRRHPNITEHVHVEIQHNEKQIDPTPLIPVPCSDEQT